MTGPRRPLEELHAASNRLWYEYWMLRCVARIRSDDPATAHALVETFALHARNVFDFLYADADADADADAGAGEALTAEDFLGDDWRGVRPVPSSLLVEIVTWARGALAPLAYGARESAAETPRSWTLLQASFEIQKVTDPFISSLPRELLGSRWKINYEDRDA